MIFTPCCVLNSFQRNRRALSASINALLYNLSVISLTQRYRDILSLNCVKKKLLNDIHCSSVSRYTASGLFTLYTASNPQVILGILSVGALSLKTCVYLLISDDMSYISFLSASIDGASLTVNMKSVSCKRKLRANLIDNQLSDLTSPYIRPNSSWNSAFCSCSILRNVSFKKS